MAPNHAQYKAYSMASQTVAKTRQVVMLYDGTIRYIKQAKEAIKENNIEQRYNLLVRASEIIIGLQASLDFDSGGDVAHMLYDFYSSIDSKLMSIHRSNSIEDCDEVIEELKEMRDVWYKIDSGEHVESDAPEQPASSEQAAQEESLPKESEAQNEQKENETLEALKNVQFSV